MNREPVIDCDVHHTWGSRSELFEYMPARWREVLDAGRRVRRSSSYPHFGGVNSRLDSFGPKGETPGSDLGTLTEQLLEPFGIERAILSYNTGSESTLPNPYLGAAIARAANDWSIDRWLECGDERIYGAVMIVNQWPEESAREIRRVGGHPRMAEVIVAGGGLGIPLGHPIHHPIYEAAEEAGLPVAIHVSGELHPHAIAAGGLPGSRFEYHSLVPQALVHHVTSFITHGVFERFPKLRLLLVELGVSWLPWLLWQLDAAYADLRRESPWVKRLPSEYFREHVWVSTQPWEPTPRPMQTAEFLASIDGVEDMLCFASDYPHWDTDEIDYLRRHLPRDWRRKVFYENACKLYGWEARSPAPDSAVVAA